MECKIYKDIKTFAKDTLSWLEKYETQNNLVIGNINREMLGGQSNDIRIAVKDDKGDIILAGIQVSPFKMALAERDNVPNDEAISLLVETLVKGNEHIPGCIAPCGLANRFATIYTQISQKHMEYGLGLNLLQLESVINNNQAQGKLRLAKEQDLYYLPYWGRSFAQECGIEVDTVDSLYCKFKERIERQEIYIWEDKHPVSVCMKGRQGKEGVAMTFVYTPPYYRGKAYASACVSQTSRKLLEEGFKHCYLFADTKNPISNRLYMNIGYKMMGVTQEIKFLD